MKKSFVVVVCLLLLGLMIVPTHAALITEYSMFGDPRPRGITVDTGGNVWFTEQLSGRIGRLSGNQIVEYTIPSAGSEPWEIVYDPDPDGDDPNADSIWFTESAKGRIGRYRAGVFVEFTLGMDAGDTEIPRGITFDYNASSGKKFKNVWFVEFGTDALGKIYYNGSGNVAYPRWVMTEYKLPPTELDGPIDLARSPVNGLLFICAYNARNVGSFNPWTRQIKIYPIQTLLSLGSSDRLQAITVGSDGIVWVALDYVDPESYDKIVRLDPWTTQVITYEIPTKGSGPRDITVDKDKNVWFTEYDKDKIGRLNPITGYITEYKLPTSGSRPLGIAVRDNIVWFTEWSNNKIGRLDPSAATSVTTVNTITSATISSTGPMTTTTASPASTSSSLVYSTSTSTATSPTATFYTIGSTYSLTTMSTVPRFATSSVTTDTETVYVLPTSITTSTTSTFTYTSSASTTISPTLTSVVQTVSSTTTTTTSETYSSWVATETSVVTRHEVFTDYITTTTITNYAATSYRFTTVTVPTFTQYSTSTLRTTTTEIASTTTIVSTVFTTLTIFTTVTAGITGLSVLLLVAFATVALLRQRRFWHKTSGGGE